MTNRLARAAAAGLALLVFARGPLAAQVVDGGAPNGGAGWNIFDDNRAAAMFTTGAISFNDIRFWGILPDAPVYTPTMYWEILNDDGGAPGTTTVASGNALATEVFRATIIPGLSSFQFDVAAGSQSLGAGVFWLALHDGPLVPDVTGSSLLWESTDDGTYAIQTLPLSDTWDVIDGSGLAFQLRNSGSVVGTPEPSTIGLVLTGLVGLAGRRRFLRRAATRTKNTV